MENPQKQINILSHGPGVYIFKNSNEKVIYIGKAKDLFRRVKQYFQKRYDVDDKTSQLVPEIEKIETISTTSEFDALLLEAKLIRNFLPKYNVISRDDKSPLYLIITFSESLPRIIICRKSDVRQYEFDKRNAIYGPFQSAIMLRNILRTLRHIVPYCTQKERRGKSCFYTHLGLCHPCPCVIVSMPTKEKTFYTSLYRTNIHRLNALFKGKSLWLSHQYEKEMRTLAKSERYEEANVIKIRNSNLKNLSSYRYDPIVFMEQGATHIYKEEVNELFRILMPNIPNLTSLYRIECLDISNLYGSFASGSLVVLIDGQPETKEYRRFRIKTIRGISDTAMIQEVLTRRLAHKEWPLPNFLLVDGGKPQVKAVRDILTTHKLLLPFAGLAKREEELIISKKEGGFATLRLPLSGKAIKVVERIRDEAHRFALKYHRVLRKKAFI